MLDRRWGYAIAAILVGIGFLPVLGEFFSWPWALGAALEQALLFATFAGLAGLFLWLAFGAGRDIVVTKQERDQFIQSLRDRPLKEIVSLLFVLSTTATAVLFFAAVVGFEPEIGSTGWRFWTASGLLSIGLLVVSCFTD
jgi:hypothetical protein